MTFGSPLWLFLLIPVSVLLLADTLLRIRKRKRLLRVFPLAESEPMRQRTGGVPAGLRHLLIWIGVLLTTFALARPQWGYTWRDARREGLQVVVALDTSNSMRADDFNPTRLQRAKWGVEEFVKALKGDRVALVAFAGEGVVQAPMTLDYGAFMMSLQDLFPGIVPRGGTNLEAALRTSMEAFEEQTDADRVILFITDGEKHSGDLEDVIDTLQKENIRVFSVGVGTPQGSLIPLDPAGGDFLKNRRDEVVKSNLNEAPLRRLAEATDGLYVRAAPRDFGVDRLIRDGLEPLKRTRLEDARVREMEERYQWFLAPGLLLLLLEGLGRLPAVALTRRRTS